MTILFCHFTEVVSHRRQRHGIGKQVLPVTTYAEYEMPEIFARAVNQPEPEDDTNECAKVLPVEVPQGGMPAVIVFVREACARS